MNLFKLLYLRSSPRCDTYFSNKGLQLFVPAKRKALSLVAIGWLETTYVFVTEEKVFKCHHKYFLASGGICSPNRIMFSGNDKRVFLVPTVFVNTAAWGAGVDIITASGFLAQTL